MFTEIVHFIDYFFSIATSLCLELKTTPTHHGLGVRWGLGDTRRSYLDVFFFFLGGGLLLCNYLVHVFDGQIIGVGRSFLLLLLTYNREERKERFALRLCCSLD